MALLLAAAKNIQTTEGTETAEKIDEKNLKFITFALGTIVEEKNVCFSSVVLGALGGYIIYLLGSIALLKKHDVAALYYRESAEKNFKIFLPWIIHKRLCVLVWVNFSG